MSNIQKAMRNRRFKVKPESGITLTVESNTGVVLQLRLENCSLSGLGASMDGEVPEGEGFEQGEILPASKLTWGLNEIGMGRLVVRRVSSSTNNGNSASLGLSTIDSRVPIDGPLSRFLEDLLESEGAAHEMELSSEKFSLAHFMDSSQSSVDLFSKCQSFSVFLQEWRKSPKFMYQTVREPSKGSRVTLNHRRKSGGNEFIIMGSNDYLGLSTHPEVLEAAKAAIDTYGFGSTGSPVTTGRTVVHEELCELLARTFKKDKALLFNSGYAANIGAMTGLTTAGDLIIADMLCHASIQDGMLMSKATSRFFKHNDPVHLEKILREHRDSHNGCLIVTEGIFSMDGDVGKVDKVVELARQYNARTFLDEAHSFGVLGDTGLGAWEKFGQGRKVDILMGTFSKICGGIGGFLVGDEEVIDWMSFFARSQMFSVSIPPSTAAAALKALEVFRREKHLVTQLHENIRYFTDGLRSMGYVLGENHESAVIPVTIGDEEKMGIMNRIFIDHGIFVVPIVYPAVSRNSCRFRFTMMSTHTRSDLDFVLLVLEKAMNEAKFSFNKIEHIESIAKGPSIAVPQRKTKHVA